MWLSMIEGGRSQRPVIRQTLPPVISTRAAPQKKRPRLSGAQREVIAGAPRAEDIGHVFGAHADQAAYREVDAETDHATVISTVETYRSATTVRRSYQENSSSHRAAIRGFAGLSTSALTIDPELFSSLTFLIPAGMWTERDRAAFLERVVVSMRRGIYPGLPADLLSFEGGQ